MNIRITAAIRSTALVLAAGALVCAQSVTYDFHRAANFSGYKTYAWVAGTELSDRLNHDRIVGAVDAQLALRGLTKTGADAAPDVLVAYHATFDKNLRINGFASGWGGYRFGGMRTGTATVDEIVVGTLIVDMVQASTKSIVWRGVATGEINPKAKPETREKNIKRAAEKIFRNYPPKKGES